MPSLKTIRKRISSTKATQKITRAMKMVAGARLTRAQQRIVAMRPYAVKTGEVLQSVAKTMAAASADSSGEPLHPLLALRPEKKALFVVFTADRGLCGALNTNVNKLVERSWREAEANGVQASFATLGRKGREYLNRRRADVVHDFPRIYEGLDLDKAKLVASWLVPRFQKADYDAVYFVFNEFKSAIAQKVVLERLLPLAPPPDASSGGGSGPPGRNGEGPKTAEPSDFLYEPDQQALLERLVPMYVEISVYRALLESQASFFGAQMTAMDAATRNAKELIARYTLAYNRARQAAITKELMEIIGGAEALKE
jgi:F-type H+-transporting ATPase subunit gamma